jgi:tetratricopeptide (TPR) repeat protein
MQCGHCAGENPDGFAYCGYCGKPLQPGEAAPRDEERKDISSVFCDIVGSTARAGRMSSEEDLRTFLEHFYDIVEGELKRFGATMRTKRGDDAVLAVYGYPNAQEDAPERAVRAALATLEAVRQRNRDEPRLDLHVRLAVTTGDALITYDRNPDGTPWSRSHYTAQRLEKQAPVDGIVVDDPTYQATEAIIEFAPAEPVTAKGIEHPLVVWRPLRPRARRGLDLPAEREHMLVGRAGELAALVAALERSIAARRTEIVTILGEAGIGKSRLVLELFRYVEHGARLINWRHGRSPSYPEGVTFWALAEIVKRHTGMLDGDTTEVAETKLHEAVDALFGIGDTAQRVERHLRALLGIGSRVEDDRREERGARFAAWRQFFTALASQRPLVLVFEDLHWAEDGLLEFIEYLVDDAPDVPLLVVCTARATDGAERDLLRRTEKWRGERLGLTRLDSDAQRQLMAELIGDTAVDPVQVERLSELAGGNPLFSVELVRALGDRGVGATGAGTESQGAGHAPVPWTVKRIIAARLDGLERTPKRLLNAAAVISRAVDPTALAAVTGESPPVVTAALRVLEDRRFLARTPASAGDVAQYRFDHPLVREVAYEGIPDRRKAELHERAAALLERVGRDRGDRAEVLAHHLRCAMRLGRHTGTDRHALETRARRAFVAAGERAAALQAFANAEGFFRDALALTPRDDPTRAMLLLQLGRSAYRSSRTGEPELAEAVAALQATGARGPAGEGEALLARLAHGQGRSEAVTTHIERAVALVADEGPTRSRLEVLVDLANILSSAREHERTLVVASEAVALARRLGLRDLEASALSSRGISRGLAGDPGGRRDLRRSVAIAEHAGSHLSVHCLGMLADLEAQMGQLRRCFRLQARARLRAKQFADRGFIDWLEAEGVGEAYWTGDWGAALETADERIGQAHFMSSYCRVFRGRIRLARGASEEARTDAIAAVREAEEASDPQLLYPAVAFAARAEVATGRVGAGQERAATLLDRWSRRRDYPASSWAVDVAYALEPRDQGGRLVAATHGVRFVTRWLAGALSYAAGDFGAAAATFRLVGSRPDEAIARTRAAASLERDGFLEESNDQRAKALRFLERVGATGCFTQPAGGFVPAPNSP